MNPFSLALVLFSLTWLPQGQSSSCAFSLNSNNFDVCAFGSIPGYFTLDTVIEGQLSFSLASAQVPNCDATGNVYSVIRDGLGNCFDVAAQDAVYSLLNTKIPTTGGIKIAFPEKRTAAGDRGFKLEVLLSCGPEHTTITNSSFSMAKIFGEANSGTTTYTVTASADYGCAQVTGCPPVAIGSGSYKLCSLNSTTFNILDTLGGHLAFNLGGIPLITGCSWPHIDTLIFGNYYTAAGYCVSATDSSIPTYTPLNYYDPTVGLQINYRMPSSTMINFLPQIQFNLFCDLTKTTIAQIQPTLDVTFSGWDLKFILTASSAFACPI